MKPPFSLRFTTASQQMMDLIQDFQDNPSIHRDSEAERTEQFHPSESATPREFGAIIASWQFRSFDPGRMGMPVRQTMAPEPGKLHHDGSTLGQYLWEIRELDLAAFEGILKALQLALSHGDVTGLM